MSTESNPIASTGYVNVGLFSHSVLEELFAARDEAEKSRNAIQTAIRSLRLLTGEGETDLNEDLAFGSYEEIDTLFRTLALNSDLNSIEDLLCILNAVLEDPTGKEELSKAIDFFLSLSQQAINSIRFPEERLPERVRSFVQQNVPTT